MGLAKGTIALTAKMVKYLYQGKNLAGKQHANIVKGLSGPMPAVAKAVNTAGQKFNQGFNYAARKIKRYPKISSGVAGGVLFDLFTRDYEDRE
jgi:hypothetical protein